MFKCQFCGNEYKSGFEYAQCVASCQQKIEAEERDVARKKKASEREARADEIKRLKEAYMKAYGEYAHAVQKFDRDYNEEFRLPTSLVEWIMS